jgi:putative ABC transport system permease protein
MPLTRDPSWARALFGAALHLYPAAYREEYGREMTLAFVDRLRSETSGVVRAWMALGAILSVVMDAPGQHVRILGHDLRLAARLIRRERWFAIVAIGTVAMGIGLSSAVFSVGKLLLIDPLPYREADRVAMVWVDNPTQGFDRDFTSYPRLTAWREQSRLIELFAAFTFGRPVLTGIGDPEQLRTVRTTPEFFRVVQTEPVVGRLFAADEEQAAVIVLSHGFWLRKFGGQSSVIGQSVRLNSVPYTVIGVVPPSFQFPERDVDAWVPLQPGADDRRSGAYWLRTVARLKPGVSLAQAREEMNAVAARLRVERPEDRDLGVNLVGLRDELAGPFRPALLMLTAAVIGVLLIACVNVAGMLVARGADRRKEVAIRTALGASRRRVARQLLTEALFLFVLGGVLGVALGSVALRLLLQVVPPTLSWLQDVSLDWPMVVLAIALAAVTGVVFGVVPSWKAAGADVSEVVASGTKGATRGGLSQRFRRTLVISEVAVATLVVSSTSLMITSLIQAQRVDLGFEPRGVLTARLEIPPDKYSEPRAREVFWTNLIERVRALPGVTGVAAGSSVLLGRLPNSTSFTIEGRSEGIRQPLTFDAISPDFFRVLQVPLLKGRYFSAADGPDVPPVAIINETTARTYWADSDPLGKRFKLADPGDEAPWLTVVGVVADTRRAGIEFPAFTESYMPYTQGAGSMTLLVRTAGDPAALTSALREAVRQRDPDQALGRVAPLDTLVDNRIAARRFNTWLLTAFGLAASVLTAIGLYGLLAYVVALRRHEMAVRLSAGATPFDLVKLMARDVSVVMGIGLSLGLAGAILAGTAIRGLLFGITPWDPLSQAITIGVLVLVAVLAAWSPARRVMGVDPAIVLRAE